jgi:hypothetical protein
MVLVGLTLVAAASPVAAQSATTQAPITGTFCIEEMTATFCNVVTSPNTSGYGGSSVSASSSGAATGTTVGSISASGTGTSAGGNTSSSIPPCPSEPPFNELCN